MYFSRNETVISKTELQCSVSQFLHSYLCERFMYFQDQFTYSAAGKCVDRSWKYRYQSQKHECGNSDLRLPEKEYINGIFVAVCNHLTHCIYFFLFSYIFLKAPNSIFTVHSDEQTADRCVNVRTMLEK
jgi:hypothetical protein